MHINSFINYSDILNFGLIMGKILILISNEVCWSYIQNYEKSYKKRHRSDDAIV